MARPMQAKGEKAVSIPHPLEQSEAQLLADCRWEHFRGPGPGGQKRNKTSSSARIVHIPSGITATAGESRSQARNKAVAFGRLKLALALALRQPTAGEDGLPAAWLVRWIAEQGGLHAQVRSDEFPRVVAAVLDVLVAQGVSVSAAAGALEVSTAQLVSFLQAEPSVLSKVNQWRRERRLRPLGK